MTSATLSPLTSSLDDSLLYHYLAKLEGTLDPDWVAEAKRGYEQVFAWQTCKELPFVWDGLPSLDAQEWPTFPYNEGFYDPGKMLLNELSAVYQHARVRDYRVPAIRANYGTVILSSILGGAYRLTDTSLPWAHHAADRAAIERIIALGLPPVGNGLGQRCLDTLAYYRRVLAPFPTLSRQVMIYHPDLQGPFDVAHLLWGPDILLALYDCPELVQALLDLVVATYIAWLRHWKEQVGEGNVMTPHWGGMIRGGAMLRDDTPVMLNARQYRAFVQPYDQRILDVFGGCIHFCGSGRSFLPDMVNCQQLYGVNMSQPDWNDVAAFWRLCRGRQLVVLDIAEAFVPDGLKSGATIRRQWAG
jgi:hypothetical protein